VAECSVPQHSPFKVEIGIGKLRRPKLSDIDQLMAKLIQAVHETFCTCLQDKQ
jgi:hypothetical protein